MIQSKADASGIYRSLECCLQAGWYLGVFLEINFSGIRTKSKLDF